MNEEMRTWLESQPRWALALFWIAISVVAVAIVLVIVLAIWLGLFFESR